MLIDFRVQNYRSIRDEQVLSMEAGSGGDKADLRARVVAGHRTRLLSVAAIYGANASGKSNLLSALGFMRDAVVDSHRSWPPQGGVPRDAFAWGEPAHSPSMFEVGLLVQGVRLAYGFVIDQARVLEEWLYAWPKGRRQVWLKRERNDFVFGEHLRGENRVIEQVTRTNALFLSTAAQHQHEQLTPIYAWFGDLRTVRVEGYKERFADAMPAAVAAAMFAAAAAGAAASPNGMVRLYELVPPPRAHSDSNETPASLDAEGAALLRQLLHAADVGISDYRVEGLKRGGRAPSKLLLRHDAGGADGWLTLDRESGGTKALVELGPVFIDALRRGGVVIVDELENSLHPLLARQIVSAFNDSSTNPRNAQLLFTTHDTNLLSTATGEDSLRRDQIWLTERDNEGATSLTPLSDYKPAEAENLERGYLQGRYGAIPFLGSLTGGKG